MQHDFGPDYWEGHWADLAPEGRGTMVDAPANVHTTRELADLDPGATGTALDAGCGAGAEAIWLAGRGWRVTGADFSPTALAHAARRADEAGVADRVTWVEADLCAWAPPRPVDLVTTHYAHPAMPQLAFYARLAGWVAPGGTLLIVGHRHTPHRPGEGRAHDAHAPAGGDGHDGPPEATLIRAADVVALLDPALWDVVTAEEIDGTRLRHDGAEREMHDVVVRAVRRN